MINREPDFDPAKPGLRSRGDAVPTNHGGELKLYFGTDRIIKWQGGTVAYATAVKSVPAVDSCPLEGKTCVRSYPVQEKAGAIFLWFGERAPVQGEGGADAEDEEQSGRDD